MQADSLMAEQVHRKRPRNAATLTSSQDGKNRALTYKQINSIFIPLEPSQKGSGAEAGSGANSEFPIGYSVLWRTVTTTEIVEDYFRPLVEGLSGLGVPRVSGRGGLAAIKP